MILLQRNWLKKSMKWIHFCHKWTLKLVSKHGGNKLKNWFWKKKKRIMNRVGLMKTLLGSKNKLKWNFTNVRLKLNNIMK
jgi:hypothetical protein